MKEWIGRNKRLIALKFAVGCALAGAHFFPEHMPSLLVNLIWLTLF